LKTIELPGDLIRFQFAAPFAFEMPKLDPVVSAGHGEVFARAINTGQAMDEHLTDLLIVKADRDLSATGREKKLDPIRARLVIAPAAGFANVAEYVAGLDEREAKLLAVPQLAATNAVGIAEDSELRAWWRAMDLKARGLVIGRMEQGAALDRLQLALLRGPASIVVADRDVAVTRDLWERSKRLDDPAEASHLATGRLSVDWAERFIAHAASMAARVVEWRPERILRALLKNPQATKGIAAFGFKPQEAADVKRQIDAGMFADAI
jgi:hypothetical protein